MSSVTSADPAQEPTKKAVTGMVASRRKERTVERKSGATKPPHPAAKREEPEACVRAAQNEPGEKEGSSVVERDTGEMPRRNAAAAAAAAAVVVWVYAKKKKSVRMLHRRGGMTDR